MNLNKTGEFFFFFYVNNHKDSYKFKDDNGDGNLTDSIIDLFCTTIGFGFFFFFR